ncbi:hypothetical protein LUQ84_001995 [Hamiltosporidium tvaerminnensis]|nr:hypothetical protein LUQ84_001995 [Hamiltosporidium tvaerminnensis]
MIIRTFKNIFLNYFICYLKVVCLSNLDTNCYFKQDNCTFAADNCNGKNYDKVLDLYTRPIPISDPSRYFPSITLSNRFHPYNLPRKSQEKSIDITKHISHNDQFNPQKLPSCLYSSYISSQNISTDDNLPRFDLAFCHLIESNQSALQNKDVPNLESTAQSNILLHQEKQFLFAQQYQLLPENSDKSNTKESESCVSDLKTPNALSSLINFHDEFDYKGTISYLEFLKKITLHNATPKSYEEQYDLKRAKKRLNLLLSRQERYVATADNKSLLSKCEEGDKLNMICNKYHNYTREYSMTRWKKIGIHIFRRLKSIQKEYDSILKSFIKLEEFVINSKEKNANDIVLNNIAKMNLDEIFIGELHAHSYKDLISSNIKNIFDNIFLKNKPCIWETQSNAQRLTYTVQELEHIFSYEIANLKSQDTDISNVIKVCWYFVDYEKVLFQDMDINMILEALNLPKMTETLVKLNECMKIDLFYEILVLIERYGKNLEQIIKKNHVVSTVFLLNALVINFQQINYTHSQSKSYEDLYKTSKVKINADIFYRGKLFEELLRNLENYETIANLYGMLNTCRFILNLVISRKSRSTLFFLQIPCLIAMILDESFISNKTQTKEFFAFILLLIKKKEIIYRQKEFYNDKIQYFFETNSPIIDKLVNFNLMLIKKYINLRQKRYLRRIFYEKCENVFKSLVALSQNIPKKDLKLKKLYASQLYWIMIFGKKSLIYSNNRNNISLLATNLRKKINELI